MTFRQFVHAVTGKTYRRCARKTLRPLRRIWRWSKRYALAIGD